MPRRKTPPPIADPASLPAGTAIAIYTRDSGGVEQERSVPDQERELDAYAGARGWNVVARYSDVARTGTDPNRRDLQRLLAVLREKPPFRVLLVWSVSRLMREMSICFELLAVTKRAGVAIVSVNEPVDPRFADLLLPLFGWQAAAQSDKTSEDIRRGIGRMIEEGYAPGGVPPRGYVAAYETVGVHRDGQERFWPRWMKDPEIAEAMETAWRLRLGGASYQAIMQATGVYRSRAMYWELFKNPAYAGFPTWWLNYMGLSIEECVDRPPVVEPYVSVPEYLALRARSPDNPRREYGNWPLSGFMECGYCGRSCVVLGYSKRRRCEVCGAPWHRATAVCDSCGAGYDRRSGGPYRYVCGKRHLQRACPESRYVGGRKVELAILEAVRPHFTGARIGEVVAETNAALRSLHEAAGGERARLEQALSQAEAEATNLLSAIARGGPSDALLTYLQGKEREIGRLKGEISLLPDAGAVPYISEWDAATVSELFQERITALPRSELRQLFRAMGLRVRLFRERMEASIEWPPLRLLLPVCSRQRPRREDLPTAHLYFTIPLPVWQAA